MNKILAFLLLTLNFCNAQEIFKNEKIGFEIEQPADWIKAQNGESLENFKEQIKLSGEKLKEIIQNNKGTVEIVTFYKYDIHSHAGLIPTIKINLRNNFTKSIETFKNGIEASFGKLKETFTDFTFITKPTIIKVDGRDCVYSLSTYTIKSRNNNEKVRSYIYAIPVENTFYQIAFMDTESDNCKVEFEKALKSIHIK